MYTDYGFVGEDGIEYATVDDEERQLQVKLNASSPEEAHPASSRESFPLLMPPRKLRTARLPRWMDSRYPFGSSL